MKKLIAMILALVMALSMVACAGNNNAEETVPPTDAPTEAPTDAPVEETDAPTEEATDAPVEEATVMTYEEYMAAAADDVVCIETYVQATRSWWDNTICVYAQGPDGAYFMYDMACSEEDAAKLVPGTKIRVTGDKAIFDGEVEIMNATFEFVEGADTYIAEPMAATELLGTAELESHMNKLASFEGLTIENISYKNDEPGDDIYVTVGYNGASYDFCVEVYLTGPESEVYTTVGELKVGDVVNVEGFLYWYNGVNTHITSITVAE